MIFVNILAGVSLVFFGVHFLRKGLNRLFGSQLNLMLEKATLNRKRAFVMGILVAVLAPSSTGMASMTVQMMSTAHLSAVSMLGVLLGAGIGLSIAVQLISLKLTSFFALMLMPGFILFHFAKNKFLRGIGQGLFALGLVFLGMGVISGNASQIDPQGDLMKVLGILSSYPWLLMLAAAVLTLILQSTTAIVGLTIGLTVGLANNGSSPHDMLLLAFPMMIGTNVGIAFINMIVGWPHLEAKRLALANLILRITTMLAFMMLMEPVITLLNQFTWGLNRQIAHLYTLFNITVAVLGFPLISQVCQLVAFLLPDTSKSTTDSPLPLTRNSYLDSSALQTPWIAMINANREILQMADMIKVMLEKFREAHRKENLALVKQIRKSDDQIDEVFRSLQSYLTQIDLNDLGNRDRERHLLFLNFAKELESIGDLIDKQMCLALAKKIHANTPISEDNAKDLEQAFSLVLERADLVISVLATYDSQLAVRLIDDKNDFNQWTRESQNRHYNRLLGQRIETPESHSYFLEILGGLRSISSHFGQLGHSLKVAESLRG